VLGRIDLLLILKITYQIESFHIWMALIAAQGGIAILAAFVADPLWIKDHISGPGLNCSYD
jgi:hypothetical protein